MLKRYLAALISADVSQAEWAVAGLGSLPAESLPEAMASLKLLLADPDPDRRWWAVRAWSALPGETNRSSLIPALQDAQPEVRQCAAIAFRLHPEPTALTALLDILLDSDPLSQRLASDALAALGEDSVQPLLQILQTGPQTSRLFAIRALSQIGDQRSIPVLFEALDDDSMIIEYWANQGLERMGVGMTFFQP